MDLAKGSADTGAIWYLAFATELHPNLLNKRLRGAKVLEKRSCQVPDAWMSFDVVGLPYLEPAFANCIVRGLNDPPGDVGGKGDHDHYKRQIWNRCCPGLPYTGELPPSLEGVAHLLPANDFERIASDFDKHGYSMHTMQGITYEAGDLDKRTGSIEVVLPVARGRRAPLLQPTLPYIRLSLLGAFLIPLSREYISHAFMLRQYEPPERKRLGRIVTFLLMLPGFVQFLLFKRDVDLFVRWRISLADKLSRLIGSGWRNDDLTPVAVQGS